MNYPQTNTVKYDLYRSKDRDVISAECLINDYLNYVESYVNEYIWQNESFKLKIDNDQTLIHLNGECNYEENINDEWFIVYILKLLTIHDPHLFVQIEDEDGQFLLIEAADYLPKWAQKPDNTIKRVYIYRNKLHLVWHKYLKSDINEKGYKFINDCMHFIEMNPEKTLANEQIQKCIEDRLDIFSAANELYHYSHCRLPIPIIILLEQHPQIISAAVRAFYYRTPDELKNIGKLSFDLNQLKVANVKFTRCLYAQLIKQNLDEPIRQLLMPSCSNEDRISQNGLKLMVGFEILRTDKTKHNQWSNLINKFFTEALNNEMIEEFAANDQQLSAEDDESWLDIDQKEFDRLLYSKFNHQNILNDEDIINNLSKNLTSFFNDQHSGIDGVEPPQSSSSSNRNKANNDSFDLINEFDENNFIQFLEKMTICEESDVSDTDSNESIDENVSKLPEMEAYLTKMDEELSQKLLSNNQNQSNGTDSDDDENSISEGVVTNLLKSLNEEIETTTNDSVMIGPATTLINYMNQID